MRRILALVVAPLLLLGLTACGDDDEPPAEPSEGESTSDAEFPVTIEHAKGTTTVDERPLRIVSLSVQWTDALLVLGVEPVAYVLDAASAETEPYPWHAHLLGDATRIDANGQLPYEAIAAERPDLILGTYALADDEVFAQLSGIAPTIGLLGALDVDPWQDMVEVAGRFLGDQEAATDEIAEVDDEIAALAAELPDLEGTTYVLANYVEGDGIYVVANPDDGAGRLFTALGMAISPGIVALDEEAVGRVQISSERADLLDADFLGILSNGSDPSKLPGWNGLEAVQSGGFVDFAFIDVVGLNTPTPLSIPHVIDLIRPALEKVAAANAG